MTSTSSIRQNQIQYYLQGSSPSANKDALLHRLRGLCDNAAEADNLFEDHEMVYIIKTGTNSVVFRVRRSLDKPESLWQLRYLGNPEGGEKTRATPMRSCVEVAASDNVSLFLEEIGFRFDHELVLKGYLFRKGSMKITVSRMYKVLTRGDINKIQPLTDSYLVELTLNTPVQQDSLGEEMKNFSEHLKPLVFFDRGDQRR